MTALKKPEPSPQSRRPVRGISSELAALAVDGVLSKKGQDVAVMDLRGVTAIADFFVLCSADSDAQVKAIAEEVEKRIREQVGEKPWHREGLDHLQWVLLDYVDVVVHVFARERRAYYALERLWGDATVETVGDDATSASMAMFREHHG
jgi:ribosome-associated protein